jgi:hypothetical protein
VDRCGAEMGEALERAVLEVDDGRQTTEDG